MKNFMISASALRTLVWFYLFGGSLWSIAGLLIFEFIFFVIKSIYKAIKEAPEVGYIPSQEEMDRIERIWRIKHNETVKMGHPDYSRFMPKA